MSSNPVLTLYDKVIEPLTDKLGIGYYSSPYRRFAVLTLGTGALLWVVKPSGLFDKDGNPRSWAAFDGSSEATPLPWYMVAGLAGTLSVLFI